MSAPTERERYIDGLRTLATALEAHPEIPLPWAGSGSPMDISFLGGDNARGDMARVAKLIPCKWTKKVWGGENISYFSLEGQIGALKVTLTAFRDAVCRRVVTGTREVTEKVKDPAKLAEVPEVEVTRTEQIVEWDCGSLLGPRAVADVAPLAVTA